MALAQHWHDRNGSYFTPGFTNDGDRYADDRADMARREAAAARSPIYLERQAAIAEENAAACERAGNCGHAYRHIAESLRARAAALRSAA